MNKALALSATIALSANAKNFSWMKCSFSDYESYMIGFAQGL